jgi:hypothetical protein
VAYAVRRGDDQTPLPTCTNHGSMAYDGCMPDAAGGVPATPGDVYLFPFYVEWMCEVGCVGPAC